MTESVTEKRAGIQISVSNEGQDLSVTLLRKDGTPHSATTLRKMGDNFDLGLHRSSGGVGTTQERCPHLVGKCNFDPVALSANEVPVDQEGRLIMLVNGLHHLHPTMVPEVGEA